MRNFLTHYLLVTGLVSQLCLLAVFILVPVYYQEPVFFFWQRAVNHLAYENGGKKQKIASLMLKTGLFHDWKNHQPLHPVFISPITTWKGQGASQKTNIKHFSLHPRKYKTVNSPIELLTAIKNIQPGEIIDISPGTYRFHGRSININVAGTKESPITLQSSQLGLVKLEFDLLEGFHVKAPYWRFENLEIKGVCSNDSRCEHAFHIVGNGHSFSLLNSIITDFNAPIKVNGLNINRTTAFPDYGIIDQNTFYNSKARNTGNPVTLLNIDSVNNWIVRRNLIADFSKAKGDHVSYGAFMKGNGKNGIFENNLIVCEMNLPPDRGVRIGLSFGGGGTGQTFCRDQDCTTEFTNGVIRNNIIAHCSHDVGIYLNNAKKTMIYNNLLHNTLGIDVRFKNSDAHIFNNIISGRIKKRDLGVYTALSNIVDSNCLSPERDMRNCSFNQWYWDLNNLDLTLITENAPIIGSGIYTHELTNDFCDHPVLPSKVDIGPIQYSNNQKCSPNSIH